MSVGDLPEHVRVNRAAWDAWAADFVAPAERCWAAAEPTWGIFSIPESRLAVLPERLDGLDAIELGCGAAYVSAWLARRGARVVGIDNSAQQLETARRLQAQHGLAFPLLHGNAESVPYPDASFDFAISEYGASLWAEPERWVPEAARLLRPGGRLVFMTTSQILSLCAPDDEHVAASDRLVRTCEQARRLALPNPPSVEFHRSPGEWLRLLAACGLQLEELTDVYAPQGVTTHYQFVTADWARRWPCEAVYKARRM